MLAEDPEQQQPTLTQRNSWDMMKVEEYMHSRHVKALTRIALAG